MAMKYWSDVTEKPYDTVEELNAAEEKIEAERKAAEEKKAADAAARKERAEEIKEAYNKASAMQKAADEEMAKVRKLITKFIEDYGSYHATFSDGNLRCFNDFFNWRFHL